MFICTLGRIKFWFETFLYLQTPPYKHFFICNSFLGPTDKKHSYNSYLQNAITLEVQTLWCPCLRGVTVLYFLWIIHSFAIQVWLQIAKDQKKYKISLNFLLCLKVNVSCFLFCGCSSFSTHGNLLLLW